MFLLRPCGSAHHETAQPYEMVADPGRRGWATECFAYFTQQRQGKQRTGPRGGEHFEEAFGIMVGNRPAAREQFLVRIMKGEMTLLADFGGRPLDEHIREHPYDKPVASRGSRTIPSTSL